MMSRIRRRAFINQLAVGATAWGAGAGAFANRGAWAQPAAGGAPSVLSAATVVPGKDARLIVLEKQPIVLETPLELLVEKRLTPVDRLFVRNNQDLAGHHVLKPSPASGDWTVRIAGAGATKLVTLQQLRELPQTSVEMVLQCSGNGRAEFSKLSKIPGTPWGKGGMGNVVLSGVKVSTLLERLGLEPDRQARFVTASGRDEPLKGDDFEHSLPLDDVLNRSFLALRMNGEDLPAVHGGPVRLVTPGLYATMHIKWLSDLAFVVEESKHRSHAVRYRVPHRPVKPGEAFTYNMANSRSNAGMTLRSDILDLAVARRDGRSVVTVKGVVFNDGAAKPESVLITLDGGQTWVPSRLEVNDSPYGWSQWQHTATVTPGKHTLRARAFDRLGRSQPTDGNIAWNPEGYEWNGVDERTFEVPSA